MMPNGVLLINSLVCVVRSLAFIFDLMSRKILFVRREWLNWLVVVVLSLPCKDLLSVIPVPCFCLQNGFFTVVSVSLPKFNLQFFLVFLIVGRVLACPATSSAIELAKNSMIVVNVSCRCEFTVLARVCNDFSLSCFGTGHLIYIYENIFYLWSNE